MQPICPSKNDETIDLKTNLVLETKPVDGDTDMNLKFDPTISDNSSRRSSLQHQVRHTRSRSISEIQSPTSITTALPPSSSHNSPLILTPQLSTSSSLQPNSSSNSLQSLAKDDTTLTNSRNSKTDLESDSDHDDDDEHDHDEHYHTSSQDEFEDFDSQNFLHDSKLSESKINELKSVQESKYSKNSFDDFDIVIDSPKTTESNIINTDTEDSGYIEQTTRQASTSTSLMPTQQYQQYNYHDSSHLMQSTPSPAQLRHSPRDMYATIPTEDEGRCTCEQEECICQQPVMFDVDHLSSPGFARKYFSLMLGVPIPLGLRTVHFVGDDGKNKQQFENLVLFHEDASTLSIRKTPVITRNRYIEPESDYPKIEKANTHKKAHLDAFDVYPRTSESESHGDAISITSIVSNTSDIAEVSEVSTLDTSLSLNTSALDTSSVSSTSNTSTTPRTSRSSRSSKGDPATPPTPSPLDSYSDYEKELFGEEALKSHAAMNSPPSPVTPDLPSVEDDDAPIVIPSNETILPDSKILSQNVQMYKKQTLESDRLHRLCMLIDTSKPIEFDPNGSNYSGSECGDNVSTFSGYSGQSGFSGFSHCASNASNRSTSPNPTPNPKEKAAPPTIVGGGASNSNMTLSNLTLDPNCSPTSYPAASGQMLKLYKEGRLTREEFIRLQRQEINFHRKELRNQLLKLKTPDNDYIKYGGAPCIRSNATDEEKKDHSACSLTSCVYRNYIPRSILRTHEDNDNHHSSRARIILNSFTKRIAIRIFQTPMELTKLSYKGEDEVRYLWLNQDGTVLHWSRKDPTKSTNLLSKVLFAAPIRAREVNLIKKISLGPFTRRREASKMNLSNYTPWHCITIEFARIGRGEEISEELRNLEFICKDDEQAKKLLIGLQSVVPLTRFHLSYGSYLWRRASLKLQKKAYDAVMSKRDYIKKVWDSALAYRKKRLQCTILNAMRNREKYKPIILDPLFIGAHFKLGETDPKRCILTYQQNGDDHNIDLDQFQEAANDPNVVRMNINNEIIVTYNVKTTVFFLRKINNKRRYIPTALYYSKEEKDAEITDLEIPGQQIVQRVKSKTAVGNIMYNTNYTDTHTRNMFKEFKDKLVVKNSDQNKSGSSNPNNNIFDSESESGSESETKSSAVFSSRNDIGKRRKGRKTPASNISQLLSKTPKLGRIASDDTDTSEDDCVNDGDVDTDMDTNVCDESEPENDEIDYIDAEEEKHQRDTASTSSSTLLSPVGSESMSNIASTPTTPVAPSRHQISISPSLSSRTSSPSPQPRSSPSPLLFGQTMTSLSVTPSSSATPSNTGNTLNTPSNVCRPNYNRNIVASPVCTSDRPALSVVTSRGGSVGRQKKNHFIHGALPSQMYAQSPPSLSALNDTPSSSNDFKPYFDRPYSAESGITNSNTPSVFSKSSLSALLDPNQIENSQRTTSRGSFNNSYDEHGLNVSFTQSTNSLNCSSDRGSFYDESKLAVGAGYASASAPSPSLTNRQDHLDSRSTLQSSGEYHHTMAYPFEDLDIGPSRLHQSVTTESHQQHPPTRSPFQFLRRRSVSSAASATLSASSLTSKNSNPKFSKLRPGVNNGNGKNKEATSTASRQDIANKVALFLSFIRVLTYPFTGGLEREFMEESTRSIEVIYDLGGIEVIRDSWNSNMYSNDVFSSLHSFGLDQDAHEDDPDVNPKSPVVTSNFGSSRSKPRK